MIAYFDSGGCDIGLCFFCNGFTFRDDFLFFRVGCGKFDERLFLAGAGDGRSLISSFPGHVGGAGQHFRLSFSGRRCLLSFLCGDFVLFGLQLGLFS
ncbi:MAG: hypothetical protein ACKPHU_13055, partial [Planctomycetaceae bacterium]